MKITTKLTLRAIGKYAPARYIVAVDGKEIGHVEKYNNSRSEKHPWKAWLGVGENIGFSGSFFDVDGGKRAAIRALLNAYLPYGKSVMLSKPISNVECWNFTDNTTGTIPAGKSLVINHIYDATHATCTVLEGIICSNNQRGWRFIVPNTALAGATGLFVPSKTRDIVGELIRAGR